MKIYLRTFPGIFGDTGTPSPASTINVVSTDPDVPP